MKILVKNMVCRRCVISVEEIFSRMKIPVRSVELGEVETTGEVDKIQRSALDTELKKLGFELIDDRNTALIEKIKGNVLRYLEHESGNEKRKNLSFYLSERLHYDYSYLSDLFSSIESKTIEQFFILQRIEKVKELIVYGEKTLSEIAYELGFSSVHHLSAQFKKTTGLTPSHFKKLGASRNGYLP